MGGSDEDGKWDVEDARRPRRANRGNLMRELLEKGLNSEEENLLNDLSDATTDSTFSGGGEEALDEVDSDFSDEEVDGVLDGAAAQTEAMLQREERRERVRKREMERRRMGGARKNNNNNSVASAPLRLRPPPTIPLAERLRAAHKRAREVRAAAAGMTTVGSSTATGSVMSMAAGGALSYNVGGSVVRPRRHKNNNNNSNSNRPKSAECLSKFEKNEEEISQRVCYTSSRSVLERFGVPVVISFSACLPRIFHTK